MAVPPNTDIIAYTDMRRRANSPVRVRGGRVDETSMQLDGFPINNLVFGGPAFDISLEAVEQIDYQRGGFDAQYGNALSGIINVATREGGTDLAGALSYQTSAVSGALGSTPDELAGFTLLLGYVSGPIPGTNNALRFMLAGRSQTGADRVLEFDNEINRPSIARNLALPPEWGDLIPGWRAFGYDNRVDLTTKLTYYVKPTMKVSALYTRYVQQRLPYDFAHLLTGFDYLQTPAARNLADSLALLGARVYDENNDAWVRSSVTQGSIRAQRDLLLAQWDHSIGARWAYQIHAGWLGQERETCNVLQGICLGDRMADTYQTYSGFLTGSWSRWWPYPVSGTDNFFGVETLDTYLGRIDVQGQATDHHTLRFGAVRTQMQLQFTELRNVGNAGVYIVPSAYEAHPWEGALYVQDAIEYDFVTIKLGLRYDFGRASGRFFATPLNPTNGTTAREICNGTVPGVSETPWTSGALSGFDACKADSTMLAQATALAQFDDFAESPSWGYLSPRIGVSLPISERAHVFFNLGQYTQHSSYNTAYQNSGIGTLAGEQGGNLCDEYAVVPGTSQCHPILGGWPTMYVGNPSLGMEKTTAYEIGFAAEVTDNVALQAVAFSKEEYGLAGLEQGGVTAQGNWAYDAANTYGANRHDSVNGYWYDYLVMANRDRQVVHGLEISLQRRISGFWGASLNYTISTAMATAAAPDLEFQHQEEEGDPANDREILSEIDRPHVLNAAVYFRVGNEDPSGHAVVNAIIQNTQLSFTLQAASGIPYTPIHSSYGWSSTRGPRNSGRGPATLRIDAFAAKDFLLANLRFGAFLRVVNLLDQQVCQQVFPSTGVCDTGTVDQRRVPRTYVYESSATSTFFDRPQYYGPRRSFNFGLRVQF